MEAYVSTRRKITRIESSTGNWSTWLVEVAGNNRVHGVKMKLDDVSLGSTNGIRGVFEPTLANLNPVSCGRCPYSKQGEESDAEARELHVDDLRIRPLTMIVVLAKLHRHRCTGAS